MQPDAALQPDALSNLPQITLRALIIGAGLGIFFAIVSGSNYSLRSYAIAYSRGRCVATFFARLCGHLRCVFPIQVQQKLGLQAGVSPVGLVVRICFCRQLSHRMPDFDVSDRCTITAAEHMYLTRPELCRVSDSRPALLALVQSGLWSSQLWSKLDWALVSFASTVLHPCLLAINNASCAMLYVQVSSWVSFQHEQLCLATADWYYPQETTIIQTMANSVLDLNWGGGFHSFLVALSPSIISNFEGMESAESCAVYLQAAKTHADLS